MWLLVICSTINTDCSSLYYKKDDPPNYRNNQKVYFKIIDRKLTMHRSSSIYGKIIVLLLYFTSTFTNRSSAALIRKYGESFVKSEIYFDVHPSDEDVEEGRLLNVECSTKGSHGQQVSYHWLVNGKRQYSYNRKKIFSRQNLKVSHADRDFDHGNFTCIASELNGLTRASKDAKIKVFYMSPYAKVRLISHAGDITAIKFQDMVRLKCEHGKARPQIKGYLIMWFHNGEKIRSHSTKLVKGNGELEFKFYPRDNGIYHCRIGHTAGRVFSPPFPIYLTEDGKIKIYDFKMFEKYIREGESAKIQCPNISNNAAVVTWSKKDTLNDASRLVFDAQIGKSKFKKNGAIITIEKMVSNFTGYYICHRKPLGVRNEIGYNFVFKVRIPKLPNILPSQFIPVLSYYNPVVGAVGTPVSVRFYIDLTAEVEPSPTDIPSNNTIPDPTPKIVWLDPRNSSLPICDSIKCGKRIFALHQNHLMIPEADITDSGTYTLIMKNEAGIRKQNVQILITSQPQFKQETQLVVEVDEGLSAHLPCETINRVPINATTITWMKDASELSHFWNLRLQKNSEMLVIPTVSMRDSGAYQCLAKTLGYEDHVISPKIVLRVREKLKIVNLSSAVYFEKNKEAKLHCLVKGYGNIKVKWIFPDPNWKNVWPNGMRVLPVQNGSTIIFDNVDYIHKGRYTCKAKSSYKNHSLSKTVDVSVGVKPQITISDDQNLVEGSSIMLNCSTNVNNKKVSWFMKSGPNSVMKSFQELDLMNSSTNWNPVGKRRKGKLFWILHLNGSLELRNLSKSDSGDYTCYAFFSDWNPSLIHKSLKLSISSEDEHPDEVDITKTVAIVVSCAVAYLLLIVCLTVFCSFNRRKRAKQLPKQEYQNLQQQNLYGYNNGNLNQTITTSAPNGYSSVPTYVNATTSYINDVADSQQLMPPPPTPMGSRSQLSGNSSSMGNSASYTRSHLSGASAGAMYQSGGPMLERPTYLRSNLHFEGRLGKSEFGDVCLAVAQSLQEKNTPCLTLVKSLLSREPSHIKEFNRQKDMFSKCDNEFIVKLLSVSFEADPLFLIFEYCDWGDLKRFLRCIAEKVAMNVPPLNYAQKITMANQVAVAMEHMSSLQLVHRDLAARNILLSPNLNLKVASLNMSVETDNADYYLLRDKKIPLRWLSPEALNKDAYSSKSDVWAFGIFMYELFTLCNLPYNHLTDNEVLQLLKKSHLYLEIPSNIPADLKCLTLKCLSNDPKDRPTFSEIVIAMEGMNVNEDV